ncbi:50S ribosomal protein L22 [Candidatus Saccharibacteria bacterium CG10_big_fil_rev_8_21_14_0_10_47_8]|nr:MAG: 50S ribosomal protein L22 [Candidatus Saccharibacteria bacterium CG10_big_fil_rev_8_21_14_0_10_47_8]
MSVKALSKSVHMSPRKVGMVAALVRGRTVADALTILEHTPRRSALAVKNTVKSAKANAEHNHGFKPDTLVITEISVTPGPRFKRYRPAARGRALPFERKTSHIRVVVDGEKRTIKKSVAKKESSETKE